MSYSVSDFEKLGVFYLGRRFDLPSNKPTDELFLYDSRDLLTHAVCIGMTGSGKTGLCIDVIEEAAIDGVPVIAIDPKGDISNLLLNFPGLTPEEFLPWLSEDDARRAGITKDELAKQQAETWRKGLADWKQDAERVKRLRDSALVEVYTPGSNAGLPVSIMGSLDAPPQAVLDDDDAFRERVNSTVGPILAMLGKDTDPLRSREHILLANIVDKQWHAGKNLTLADLIQMVQKPPISRIGALDVDSFFPAKERFAFAMSINNLIAAPGFDAWLKGPPLSIDRFLYSQQGKPKISIFSIAHLSDAERMFFVSLLLSQFVSWMRGQSGTTSLRAILYMDEIFGFFPPISNPPSKIPLLTLLKQARAFGIGIMLASQNPVDLDYKGLSNAGTWFIGRLQTERDKLRVLDGLEGAASETGNKFDRGAMERTLSALARRIFLVNNVHADKQEIIETRWSLSYLRGPLTKTEIKKLMAEREGAVGVVSATSENAPMPTIASSPPAPSAVSNEISNAKPSLPPGVQEYFIVPASADREVIYKPMLLGAASVRFADSKTKVDVTVEKTFITTIGDGAQPVNWSDASVQRIDTGDLKQTPPEKARFETPAPAASKPQSYKDWSKDFVSWLCGSQKFHLLRSPSTGELSQPLESERQFRMRLNDAATEARDKAVEQLRQKYAPKVTSLQDKILQAEQRVEREREEEKEQEMQAAISIGATILGAFAGRKTISRSTVSKASSAARGAARANQQKAEVARAQQTLDSLREQFQQLQDQFARETNDLRQKYQASTEALEMVSLAPKKTNVNVHLVTLVWAPFYTAPGATREEPAW